MVHLQGPDHLAGSSVPLKMKMSSLPHHGSITWGPFFPLHPQNRFCCLTTVYPVLSMCQEIVCRTGCIQYQLLCGFSASLFHWPLLQQQFCGVYLLTGCNLTSPSSGPAGIPLAFWPGASLMWDVLITTE